MIKILWTTFLAMLVVTLIGCGDKADKDVNDVAFDYLNEVSSVSVSMDKTSFRPGDYITITGSVSSNSGSTDSLDNERVMVELRDTDDKLVSSVETYTYSDGGYTIYYTVPDHANSNLTVTAIANEVKSAPSILIYNAITTVTVSADPGFIDPDAYTHYVTITGAVTGVSGAGIENVTVSVVLTDTTGKVVASVTDNTYYGSGEYYASITLPSGVNTDVTVVATAGGVSSDPLILTYDVPPAATSIVMTADAVTIDAGGSAAVTGYVMSATGQLIDGKRVAVEFSTAAGVLLGTQYVTTSSGEFKASFTASAEGSGNVTAKAIVDGVASSVVAFTVIYPEEVVDTTPAAAVVSSIVLHTDQSEVTVGDTLVITGYATDSSGNPVTTRDVTIRFADAAKKLVAIQVATTDSSGAFSLSYVVPSFLPGSTTITATSGSATSNSKDLTVNPKDDGTDTGTDAGVVGVPAKIVSSPSRTNIEVKEPGTVGDKSPLNITVYDGANVKITDTSYNNLRISLVNASGGGERLSWVDSSNKSHTTDDASDKVGSVDYIYAKTTSGVATLEVESGLFPTTVNIKIEVVHVNSGTTINTFIDTDNDNIQDTGESSLPSAINSDIVITSGLPHSLTFSYSHLNSIVNLNQASPGCVVGQTAGFYCRKGSLIVTDKFGNAVADGTVVYLGLVDSIIAEGSDAATTASTTVTSAAPHKADNTTFAAGTATTFTTASITRNGTERKIEANDRVMLTSAADTDKVRYVSTIAANTITALQSYSNTAVSLAYQIGASTLGGTIFGVDADGNALNGYVKTVNGIGSFEVIYPNKSSAIKTGCFTDATIDKRV
ncbi:MAG: hypothetical protein HQL49_13690, partial [Gammaproteobacteria bacterium]|nr:hypothetical protein [Gammaproteobacteria bacterium]